VPDEPSGTDTAAKPPAHSRTYERGMGLLFLLGAVAAVFVVFFVLSFFD
jgi:hypothetical protein